MAIKTKEEIAQEKQVLMRHYEGSAKRGLDSDAHAFAAAIMRLQPKGAAETAKLAHALLSEIPMSRVGGEVLPSTKDFLWHFIIQAWEVATTRSEELVCADLLWTGGALQEKFRACCEKLTADDGPKLMRFVTEAPATANERMLRIAAHAFVRHMNVDNLLRLFRKS